MLVVCDDEHARVITGRPDTLPRVGAAVAAATSCKTALIAKPPDGPRCPTEYDGAVPYEARLPTQ